MKKIVKQYHTATAGWFTWQGHRARLSFLGAVGALLVLGVVLPALIAILTLQDQTGIMAMLMVGVIIAGLLSYPMTVQRIRDVVGSNNLYILSSLVATVLLPFVVFLWLVFPGREEAK